MLTGFLIFLKQDYDLVFIPDFKVIYLLAPAFFYRVDPYF
jgi:hypothetical protein